MARRDALIHEGVAVPPGATNLWVGIGRGNFDRQKHYMRMFGEQILPHFV
jgi:hypothetical protein